MLRTGSSLCSIGWNVAKASRMVLLSIPEAFDADALKAEADKAADMLSVPVYGGDCVVGEDGSVIRKDV